MPTEPRQSNDSASFPRDVSSWEGGFTSFPNALFRQYARLGMSEGELVFVQQLWTFWWGDQLPFPALGSIAERMGKKIRQVQQYVHSLRARGLLLVVPRADAQGRQLTNAYDPRPLLRALADLREVPTVVEAGAQGNQPRPVLPASPATTPHNPAASGVWNSTPKEHEQKTQQDLDLGSVPLPPAGQKMNPPGAQSSPVSDALLVRLALAPLSTAFGDEAPRASGSRAYALAQCHGIPLPEFEALLHQAAAATKARLPWVERRTPDEQVNAMPYFFGILERLLAHPAEPDDRKARPRQARRHSVGHPPNDDVSSTTTPADAQPDDTPFPFWRDVVDQARRFVAPGAVARLAHVRVREASPAGLCLEVASAQEQFWLERMLRSHLLEALADLGHAGCDVRFVAGPVNAITE